MPGKRDSEAVRGEVTGFSDKSMRRLVFALENAACDFGVMATLTFRELILDGRSALAIFQREIKRGPLARVPFAWVREYQERGAVHYHYLFALKELEEIGWLDKANFATRSRKGVERTIVKGPLEQEIVRAWTKATGDDSEEFRRFQNGGIVELFETKTGASKYFASYLGKEHQKTLPAGANVTGRWWFLSPEAKPIPPENVWLTDYPFATPYNTIFDASKLDGMITRQAPVEKSAEYFSLKNATKKHDN